MPKEKTNKSQLKTKSVTPKYTLEETNQSLLDKVGDQKYSIVLADPPWEYQVVKKDGILVRKGMAAEYYNTISLKDLKSLKVPEILDVNAICCMWTTGPKMKESIELIESWGFKYITMFGVWGKTTSGKIQGPKLGNYTRQFAEFVLLGTKGTVGMLINNGLSIPNLWLEDSKEHSQKPKKLKKMIDTLFKNVPKIELFARESTDLNWDYWGNQTSKFGTKVDDVAKKKIRETQNELRIKLHSAKRISGAFIDRKNKYGTDLNGQSTLFNFFKGLNVEVESIEEEESFEEYDDQSNDQ